MKIRPLFRKYFGVVSTVLLGVAALTPDVFRIPATLRPWVFVTFVFWSFLFSTGQFS